jgi:hypothetical protein
MRRHWNSSWRCRESDSRRERRLAAVPRARWVVRGSRSAVSVHGCSGASGRPTATVVLSSADDASRSRADMVSFRLHFRHATEIYVRCTIRTGTNG